MRKIIATTQLSLDGVMQAPGGPEEDTSNGFTQGGWFMHYGDDTLAQVFGCALRVGRAPPPGTPFILPQSSLFTPGFSP